jgi:Protein of unknown function (DUF1572)
MTSPDSQVGSLYLGEARHNFDQYKRLAEKAFAQLQHEHWFACLDPESNSIALIVKHLSGNMRSRFTDFLTTDGEKPDRNRDQEFVMKPVITPEQVLEWWESGWSCVFRALDALQPDDLQRTVYIRGQEHTVLAAINRQLLHYAHHIGQIVFLAKHLRGAEWKSLSIPKGQSATIGVQAEQTLYQRPTK